VESVDGARQVVETRETVGVLFVCDGWRRLVDGGIMRGCS